MERTIHYEHSLRHSYMHIDNISVPRDTYEYRLLKETCIPGTVKMNFNAGTDDNVLSYIVSGLESMEKYLEANPMTHTAISTFMECLNSLLCSLEEYMVSENSLFLSPSSVFFSPDSNEWLFTLVPSFENSFRSNLSDFLSYLLKHIDYKDDRAVIIAYSLFQESGKEFYQLTDLLRIVRTNMAKEEQEKNTRDTSLSRNNSTSAEKKLISDDGIFRPIDAGIVLNTVATSQKNDSASASSRDTASSNGDCPHEVIAPSLYKEPPISGTVRLPAANKVETGAFCSDTDFSSDYGKDDYPFEDTLPGVTVKNLSEEDHPKLFGIFSFPRKKSGTDEEAPEQNIREHTIEEALNEKTKSGALKGKLTFTVLLMALIPSLVWFLKGALIFKKALPLILALEIGLCMMIALDLIMNKLPDEG